jgi:UDP-glucose 4-epimerase
MRIVVVGATGNVGTAVLRRLHEAGVEQLVGVARRLPDESVEPYSGVQWHPVNVGDAAAPRLLEDIFRGADAVIHLAWALQPNRDESAMRRANVTGTANTLAAVAAAAVPQVVVASSVGAYSFGPKRSRVDENWPTGGVSTSHYSRHKAANERALDRFEEAHPGIIVTRLRPGLIFQRDAGLEIAGLFLGRLFPTAWLGAFHPKVLPFPSQGIFQAVHASDVADAYWRVIERRAAGAFNIAAEPVLDPAAIAAVLGAQRTIPVRARVVRALIELSWRLGIQQTDPGWLDIATSVPIMSTERARRELEWVPKVSSTDALAEIVAAVADRSRHAGSGPLGG